MKYHCKSCTVVAALALVAGSWVLYSQATEPSSDKAEKQATGSKGKDAKSKEGTSKGKAGKSKEGKSKGKAAAKMTDTDEIAALASATQGGKIWAQWGGSSLRNNTPDGKNIPTEWATGVDTRTQEWVKEKSKNVKWMAKLGSQSYGNPVIGAGKVFVGTNNGAAWLSRYPANVDLGCMLCFDQADGKFLWQHSSEKLPTGRVHDWPQQGICCAPLVEGDRLWFVSSRGHVLCLDTEGFHDGENDGPFTTEPNANTDEADTVWDFDMMNELRVSQHNMCSCSVTIAGDLLFVCTGNGVDDAHTNIPSPEAPSFMAMDKNTGKVLWTDSSPGKNILHGQWSSPAYAVLGGVAQVIFGGGDGWLYSFAAEGKDGMSDLLWKFDCNPKESKYSVNSKSTRNHLIATPVVHKGLVYISVGEDPEHGEGNGHVWCIDPTKRGDVSSELAFNLKDPKTPLPPRRLQCVVSEDGEVARPNPNSAAVWHYVGKDWNGNGKLDEFEEEMHRTCGTVTIKDDLLFLPDFSGLVHCLDAKTGEAHWVHDLLAANWSSALIVEDHVYIGDEEGKVTIFALSKEKTILNTIQMGSSVYTSPVVADNVLYIADKNHVFAIQAAAE